MPNSILEVDGSLDFSGGVDSLKVTTIQSQTNPNGLARNELAWLNNATVRDGGILQRTGWQYLSTLFDSSHRYQGGYMYEPDFANPYLVLSVSGHIYKVVPDFPALVDLSLLGPNLANPNTDNEEQANFTQAEQFLIIQAGNFGKVVNPDLPLFWDGNALRRSIGITNTAVAPGTPGVNEIPAATSMDYYMGRLWFARGRTLNAGDIVFGSSGTNTYAFRDSVLDVTENPLVVGGDGFTVPTNAGNIRALFHNANLNTQLGQGQLFAGTRKSVYSLDVPVSRTDWIAATGQNQPLMKVVQINSGPVGDRCIVKVNGDVFYQSLEPGIRSLFSAIRYFDQWGNVSLSSNIERLLAFDDRSLLHAASGVYFDNRLLMTELPFQTPQGVIHRAIAPMDFIPLSSFGANLVPVWEGMYEGLDFLQLFTGDFGGRERAFAIVRSRIDASIQLWEMTDFERSDFNSQRTAVDTDGESRVTWVAETPAYTFGNEFNLKRLATLELWFDKLYGETIFKVEWRPDSDPCWKLWHEWKECQARNSCEDVNNPVCYPIATFREGFRATRTLPRPPAQSCVSATGRPPDTGYQFQIRLTIKGWARIRGLMLHAVPVEKKTYEGIVC